jgi:hypothetical protein
MIVEPKVRDSRMLLPGIPLGKAEILPQAESPQSDGVGTPPLLEGVQAEDMRQEALYHRA